MCQSFQPDCLLLDYRFPGQDGLAFLHYYSTHIPPTFAIIMLTGQGNELVAVEAMKTGAQDYLVKNHLCQTTLRRAICNAIEKVHLQQRLAKKQAELERLAWTDSLTDLPNRRFLQKRLEEEIVRATRYQVPLSALMLDIDHFKKINDTYGHAAGDQVLIQVGLILKEYCRGSDFPTRYGGEEFCILAPNTTLEGAKSLAERIREELAKKSLLTFDGIAIPVTCSIGVATYHNEMLSGQELIEKADEMLYLAKGGGRNRVCGTESFLRVNGKIVGS